MRAPLSTRRRGGGRLRSLVNSAMTQQVQEQCRTSRLPPHAACSVSKDALCGTNIERPRFSRMLRDEERRQWGALLERLTPNQRRALLVAVLKMLKREDGEPQSGNVTPIRPTSGPAQKRR
jgi:DNA-directed RNA polymerase specialized sigma24 family protein